MFFRFQKNFINNYKFNFIKKKNFLVFDKNLYISPSVLFYDHLKVHVGNLFFFLTLKENMIGFKIKDFIFTKKRARFKYTKIKKRKK